MHSVSFLEKLLTRLKSGDARSIHLNAMPGNFARLDIYDLSNINTSLHLAFLETLLTKKSFQFTISIEPDASVEKSAEQKRTIQRIIKRLNHLEYQEREEFAEHGYRSFGFGYPLLIKRDPANPDRIIKAPLLIWYLSIEKDTRRNNTWIISRNEDHPLIFNELLQTHFESSEKIKTDDLQELIDEDFIDEKNLTVFCKQLLDKLHISMDATETIATLLPCTNKEAIENYTKDSAWIRWSGVFGLYKMQKQPIIKDVELLIQSSNTQEEIQQENTYFDGEVLTPVTLDPSQENVLHQLQHNNRLIIQGPPGTGKSQTLTAIITQALLNKQKVLVVCEKRTAMEVLYNNLKKEDLHHLCAIIEDVYGDRKNIVERVRQTLEDTQPVHRFRQHEYELDRTKFLSLQEELNFSINFTGKEIFGDDNWIELLYRSAVLIQDEKIRETARALQKQVTLNSSGTFAEYRKKAEKIKTAQGLFKRVHEDAVVFSRIDNTFFSHTDAYTSILEHIDYLHTESSNMELSIRTHLAQFKQDFNLLDGLIPVKVRLLALFSASYKKIEQEKISTIATYLSFKNYAEQTPYIATNLIQTEELKQIDALLQPLNEIRANTAELLKLKHLFTDYFQYRHYLNSLEPELQQIINELSQTNTDDWENLFTAVFLNQLIDKTAAENSIREDSAQLLQQLVQRDEHLKLQLSNKIKFNWQEIQRETIAGKDLTQIKYLYNQRKNKHFASKNSLRKIIHEDIDFFTTLFPVLMVNPAVCTSVLPLQENLFDFIILDEASQLRIEDTYSSLLRAKIKIISGDKHQMPPSNFFGSEVIFWESEDDETGSEHFLAESKSLLEYADDAGFKNAYLDFHYRSLHPDLIQFSNHAFYQSRLIPMPEKSPYQAMFYTNVDGIYQEGVNKKEADAIVDFIYSTEKMNGAYPGIGIATFNLFQRNLILDELYERAYADPQKNELLQELLNKGLFVKNLENIQGDERDIMILSTTFGKDEHGKFRQFFGPLTQEKGYQLLNVIITRAKYALYVFTSIPEQVFMQFETELMQKGNKGKSVFYAYLAYVKSVSAHNTTQTDFILNRLENNGTQIQTGKSQPATNPFIKLVFDSLKQHYGPGVQTDIQFGGFRLDMVLYKDNRPFLNLEFEHTHAYHAEVAYREKLHKQKILAQYGIITYHIWSYNWWKNPDAELNRIISLFKV
jgi:DNA polymerase III delta prime subunit